jgi:hypothetical protein
MSGITHKFPHPVVYPSQKWGNLFRRIDKTIHGFVARIRNRDVVANLSQAQLFDCGIDQAKILGNRPKIEVDARHMRYLRSFR